MKAHDLIELAARNLRESVLRNSLTTLGISVGVASLVAMLSLGIGLQELASRRLTRSGLFDMVVVYSRREAREFSREERRATPGGAESRPLDDQAREEITRIPHVLEVHSDVRFPTEVRFEGKAHFTMVAGIPPSAKSSDAFDAMKGNFFSGPAADEAIL
ncbi:MAG: ABC transporter permease, partial [Acidobacteria bacterium]|nr:ABC transporter permease [Acidobacteriota bacterium]